MKLVFTAALVAAFFMAGEAGANHCRQSYDVVEDSLWRAFEEVPVATAINKNGELVTVFASEGGATYTIVITTPATGVTCGYSSGQNWRVSEPKPPGSGT